MIDLTPLVARLTAAGIAPEEARPEVQSLVRHALALTREQLFLRDRPLDDDERARVEPLLARRERREPLAYILGQRGFYGLTLRVTPAVLIPRPETELLIDIAADFVLRSPFHRVPQLADIGTGSGCIALALAYGIPAASVYATDISPDALAVARQNDAQGLVRFSQGDLYDALPAGHRFHVIVSNPPYIAPGERESLQPEVRDWEPAGALFDTGDGLGFYRRLAAGAHGRLAPGGMLAVEVGAGQAEAVAQLFADAGLLSIAVADDLAGIARVVSGIAGSMDALTGDNRL